MKLTVQKHITTRNNCACAGEGFAELAAKLIGIGAKYGNIAVDDVLPSGRTVSRHVQEVVASEKLALVTTVADIKRFGVTTDGWTHDATTTTYITVTLHYIDEVCHFYRIFFKMMLQDCR